MSLNTNPETLDADRSHCASHNSCKILQIKYSSPLPSTTLTFDIYLHIFLTSEFVDFRFPKKGKKFIPSTSVPLLGTRMLRFSWSVVAPLVKSILPGETSLGKLLRNVGFETKSLVGAWIVRSMSLHQAAVWVDSLYIYIWIYWICEDIYIPDICLYTYWCSSVGRWQCYMFCILYAATNGKNNKAIGKELSRAKILLNPVMGWTTPMESFRNSCGIYHKIVTA